MPKIWMNKAAKKVPLEPEYKQKILDILSALIPKAKVYLFGSRARGTHSEFSDIDIAIDAGEALPFRITGEIRAVLNGLYLPYKIEVVDFHLVSEQMKQMILQEGLLWRK